MRDSGAQFKRIVATLGGCRVTAPDFYSRRDCGEPGPLGRLQQARGVFFTGGNQLRLSSLLGGTPIAKAAG